MLIRTGHLKCKLFLTRLPLQKVMDFYIELSEITVPTSICDFHFRLLCSVGYCILRRRRWI